MTPFEQTFAELRKLGIILRAGAGEYRLNYQHGGPSTEIVVEELADAIQRGREMTEQTFEREAPLGPMGPRTARRTRMYSHNRKVAARRKKRQSSQ